MLDNEKKFDVLKIVLPVTLAVILFTVSFFGLLLPAFRDGLLEKKKEASKELVHTAIHIFEYFNEQVTAGALSLGTAQAQAIKLIRNLRYGTDGKDYFWINDLTPKMIMHPYRPDLEGKDVSKFLDPEGTPLFRNFVRMAKEHGSGYVPYIWQLRDNPERLEHKLSYIELYAPWGWVIGTGVYLTDITREVERVTRQVVMLSCAMLAGIVLLCSYIIWNGMQISTKRRAAEAKLLAHEEQLEELVEIRTRDLKKALSEVKTLSGLLPICASCKKIRDDSGYWQKIETYIREHSGAQFSHDICPDCAHKLYPELMAEVEANQA